MPLATGCFYAKQFKMQNFACRSDNVDAERDHNLKEIGAELE